MVKKRGVRPNPLEPPLCTGLIGDDANKILWKKSSIKVAFLKKKVFLFKEWGLDADTILKWANRWSSDADSKIPTFEFRSEEKNADIIVELNGIVHQFTVLSVWFEFCWVHRTVWQLHALFSFRSLY